MSFEPETTEAHERRIVRCREPTCNARIIFLHTAAGNPIPVDADTVEPEDQQYEPGKHEPHFATCKTPARFRKPR